MSEQKAIDLNLVELVGLGVNILQQAFINAPKDKSKPLFKELKSGKSMPMGFLTIQEKLKLELKLELDYSEFCGPGFNADVFITAVDAMIKRITVHLKSKKDLNIMTSEDNTALIHVPGVIQTNHQYNVLLMAFDIGHKDKIILKLMFVDPEQYKELKS